MGNVVPYERSDILTEGGACVLLIHSVDVRHVLVVPGLCPIIKYKLGEVTLCQIIKFELG